MEMKKFYDDLHKVLVSDETLLRLLYYKPKNRLDDPLSLSKPNIKTMDVDTFWSIADDVFMSAPKFSDMEKEDATPKCRIMFYLGDGEPTENQMFSEQDVVFDVYTHSDFEIDRRNAQICDRLYYLFSSKTLEGVRWKLTPRRRGFVNAPPNYLGYSISFKSSFQNYGV